MGRAKMRGLLLGGAIVLSMAGSCWASGYQEFIFGVAARNRDDAGEAIKRLTSALAAPDLSPSFKAVAYFDRGDAYLASGNADAAITDFSAALNAKPDYIYAYTERAVAYRAERKYDLAIADLGAAIRLRPRHPEAYLQRMSIYAQLQRYDDELADCNALLGYWPGDPDFFVQRGLIYRSMGKYALAIAESSGAIAIDPAFTYAYSSRGRARQLDNDLDGAIDDFDKAISLDRDDADAQMDKGFAEWQAGRFDKAEKAFRRAVDLSPTSVWGYLSEDMARIRMGDRVSHDFEDKAGSLDLANWPGPLAALFLGKLTPDQLVQVAAQGEGRDPRDQACQAQLFLGEWYNARGDSIPARKSLQQAAMSCPSDMVELSIARSELARMPAAEGGS
ncbi:MAG: tetratricopeptide repeat protein [Rhizomicrobium sp.]|jgi:tetratricopeptide (TPR) repeat protein